MANNVGKEGIWDTLDSQAPTIKGRVTKSSGFGDFLRALGSGLKKIAQVGWDAVKIIGEHADELFPDHYSAYEAYKLPLDADGLFEGDDYLQQTVFNLPKTKNLIERLRNGDSLDDDDIKQADLLTSLLEARSNTKQKQFASQAFRTHMLQALVGNQLYNAPRQDGKVQYRGHWVDEHQAPYLVKSDIHSLLQKDRRMTLPEIQEWTQMPSPRPRSLNPSGNRGGDRTKQSVQSALITNPIPPATKRLFEGEHPSGSRSDEKKYPPIKLPRMDAATAYTTFYTGQGQSYEVPFSSIEFRNGTFRQDSQFMNEVKKLTKEAQQQGTIVNKDINLPNQGYEFEDKRTDEAWVYGNIQVDVKGELLVDAKGSWEFGGTFFPALKKDDTSGEIYRGDRFNFNPKPFRERTPEGELATRFFHSTPGTSYKIYFIPESVKVWLSNRR